MEIQTNEEQPLLDMVNYPKFVNNEFSDYQYIKNEAELYNKNETNSGEFQAEVIQVGNQIYYDPDHIYM